LFYTSNDDNFIVLSDGHSSDLIFVLQIFGKMSAHELSSDVGGRRKMSLSLLSSGAGDF